MNKALGAKAADFLRVHGVKRIELRWAGSGDSGDIEEVVVEPDYALPDTVLDKFCDELVKELAGGGLEINEGGAFEAVCTPELGVEASITNYSEGETDPYSSGTDISAEEAEEEPAFLELLDQLGKLGVESAEITWAGGGDSGGFEGIEITGGANTNTDRARDLIEDWCDGAGSAYVPEVEWNNDGGRWVANLSVKDRTFIVEYACNFTVNGDTEGRNYDATYGWTVEEKRCEWCGFEHAPNGECKPPKALNRIRDLLFPIPDPVAVGVDRKSWEPIIEVESRLLEDPDNVDLKMALIACRRIQAGQPAWTLEELCMENDGIYCSHLRFILGQYPYKASTK
jgi:hypothetical protein